MAGEFGGSYRLAAREPECVALDISHQLIQYHMDQKRPLAAADRAVDRVWVAAEAAAATSARGVTPVCVFVERGGSASAATAVLGIVGKIECELEARIGKAVHLARHDAATAHQAELEVVEMETVDIKKRMKDLKAQQSELETEARRFAKEVGREIALLQGRLAGEQKRADAAEAKKIGDV